MVSNDTTRNAITVTELMVAMTIMGMLMLLLLPALQAARAASRRCQCLQHLQQIGLAVHGYHTSWRCFPIGAAGGWGHGWHAYILPYLEQDALYDTIPWSELGWWAGAGPNSIALQRLASTPIATFNCPAQPYASFEPRSVNGLKNRAIGSYLGNAGGNLRTDNLTDARHVGPRDANGILLVYNMITSVKRAGPPSIAAVVDGTSTTLLAAESPYSIDGEYCTWCDRFYGYHSNIDSRLGSDYSECLGSTYYPINVSLSTDLARYAKNSASRELSFGSYHAGGCNAVLADGATRFVKETIDLSVWRAVGSRNGIEVIGHW